MLLHMENIDLDAFVRLAQSRRSVRGFRGDPVPEGEGEAGTDRRASSEPLEARFEVTLLRVSVPGTRIESSAIQMSTRSDDPLLRRRGVGGRDRIAIASDDALAARLAQALQERLGAAPLADANP